MKRFILFFLFATASIILRAYDFTVDGIYYNILTEADNTVEVTYENQSIGLYNGDIVIPETVVHGSEIYTVTSIGYSAFHFCSSLNKIAIPNTITNIKAWAFFGCSGITEITIPNSVVSIGYSAFEGCYALSTLIIEDCDEALAFEKDPSNQIYRAFEQVPLKKIYLGRDIKYSVLSPFHRNDKIESITLGKKVTTINETMFLGCKGIQNLQIPSNINYIGNKAFSECTGLKTIVFEDGNKNLIISSNINDWGPFYSCTIDSLYLGRNVTAETGRNAMYTFRGTKVRSIFVGESVNNIPDGLFCYCSELERAYITKNIKKIGKSTFCGSWIRDVYCYSTNVIPIEVNAFYSLPDDSTTLHVPYVSLSSYKNNKIWSKFKTIKSIEDTYRLSYFIDGELYQCYDLLEGTTIPIPEKVGYTFIGLSEIPNTMPAENVEVSGYFIINKYLLTYIVDEEIIESDSIEYNTSLTAIEEPTKEGHTFLGWSEIPETMPAYDVTVTGTFSINSYKLTYMIDNTVYKELMYEYGATINPEPQPEGDYETLVWIDLPETMPAHDVVVYASYTTGIEEIFLSQNKYRIYGSDGKPRSELQKGLNIVIRVCDGMTRKIIVK